jgi:hypothetical protein
VLLKALRKFPRFKQINLLCCARAFVSNAKERNERCAERWLVTFRLSNRTAIERRKKEKPDKPKPDISIS